MMQRKVATLFLLLSKLCYHLVNAEVGSRITWVHFVHPNENTVGGLIAFFILWLHLSALARPCIKHSQKEEEECASIRKENITVLFC